MIGLMKMVAASTVALMMVGAPAQGGGSGGLLCPSYADAARVTAEGMRDGVTLEKSLSMAEDTVTNPDVLIVLKVVIAYVYQDQATPDYAYEVVLTACTKDGW